MNLDQARAVAQGLREYEAKDCCSQRTEAANTIDALVAYATEAQALIANLTEQRDTYRTALLPDERDNLLNGG